MRLIADIAEVRTSNTVQSHAESNHTIHRAIDLRVTRHRGSPTR
jgi:hypothetical protein